MKLKVQPLNAEAFAPFGQILARPDTEPTASVENGTLDFWADVITLPGLSGGIGIGYATVEKRPFVQTCVERHMETPEFLQATQGDMIVAVGPALYPDDPQQLAPLDQFAAFRVPEGQAVVLKPGVWHYAPFAAENPITLTVIFKAGTSQNDVAFVDFSAEASLELEL